ncbi:hypothetical protein [Desulfovibrio subterraneus]|uniref:hypothetical protein n=1 Tax=Desulfovibrio subterraneus TaxID=2718620 RepID=UPI00157A2884|nr:hypothetical protein [Desulfovibrio subterraneus]
MYYILTGRKIQNSADAKNINAINEYYEFSRIVAKGNTFLKIAMNNHMPFGGKTVARNVAEHIPILDKGKLVGAFKLCSLGQQKADRAAQTLHSSPLPCTCASPAN